MKKSKVDAIVKKKVAEAATSARYEGQIEGRRLAREEFELMLVPPDDGSGVCVLGEKPQHNMIFVAIYPGRHTRLMADPGDFRERDFMAGVQRAAFRPIQMCQTFQTGQRVVWYNYQFEGLR